MYTFDDLVGIIAKLRSPEGCPWDREQTFESLKKCLSDETQEVFQAIDNDDMENLCEELGGRAAPGYPEQPDCEGGRQVYYQRCN